MKKSVLSLALVIALAGLLTLVGCAGKSTTPEAFDSMVRATWVKYADYVRAGDTEKYMSLWDEEGVQLPPGTPMKVGKAAIKEGTKADFESSTMQTFDIALTKTFVDHEFGFAYGTYKFAGAAKANGEKFTGDGKYETIFRRQADGSWKIFRDCFNSNLP